mmetsp:Transcript_11687/g.35630  ORF Transcript_11687/g.35630 Transcript_11687/m.35630 type:complete len:85 (-) Transcript_11687:752-1006(-)
MGSPASGKLYKNGVRTRVLQLTYSVGGRGKKELDPEARPEKVSIGYTALHIEPGNLHLCSGSQKMSSAVFVSWMRGSHTPASVP